ncbi:MAG: hypothetical protein IJP09_01140 [Clostridia bacterium]|nr:hypothetical protein [Clostridia bacterium]
MLSEYGSQIESKDLNEQIGLIDSDYDMPYHIVAEENVILHGAKGDGLTDDTEAFKSALAAAEAKGGGTVFVPAGFYCLTETLIIPQNVGIVGELEKGTANGTVLCIYGGKGEIEDEKSAIRVSSHSAVMNVAFWYPEQTLVNGDFIPYPPTICQNADLYAGQDQGVTLKNVTFINSYIGISNTTASLQNYRDISGTCLYMGFKIDGCYDTPRFDTFNLSPDFWIESGLPGTPNAELLRTWMLRNSTGMVLRRVDWTFYRNINIDGYHIGVFVSSSEKGIPHAFLSDMNIVDCYYCFYMDSAYDFTLTDCNFRAVGNDGAAAVYIGPDCDHGFSVQYCNFESVGANAIVNCGKVKLSMVDCTVKSQGTAFVDLANTYSLLVNSSFEGSDNRKYQVIYDENTVAIPETDLSFDIETKPASKEFVNLSQAPYNAENGEDISEKLQSAIDSLKETGGTVYIPAGKYYVNEHIDVWAGIEVRGAIMWAEKSYFSLKPPATDLNTSFGKNDPDGESLFTLYDGAGMRGLSITYNEQNITDLVPYSFAIQGNGAGIYLVDLNMTTSYNGIDFATYRCDNHFVDYIHTLAVNIGIQVGAGSENGIIRDYHANPSNWGVNYDIPGFNVEHAYSAQAANGEFIIIGESKNQIISNSITFGNLTSLKVLDGAENVYAYSLGHDAGNIDASLSGNCTVTMVNPRFTAFDFEDFLEKNNKEYWGRYVYTAEDFTGTLNMVNPIMWVSPNVSFDLNGTGSFNVYGGIIVDSGSTMLKLNGNVSIVGTWICQNNRDFEKGEKAESLHLSANYFEKGMEFDNLDDIKLSGSNLENYGK